MGSLWPHNWFSQAAEDFVIRHREYPEGWYLVAAHLLVRRNAFQRLNGFSSTLYRGEDWDFCKRAHGLGMRVGVTSTVAVCHANPTSWRQLAARHGSMDQRMPTWMPLLLRHPVRRPNQQEVTYPAPPAHLGRFVTSIRFSAV